MHHTNKHHRRPRSRGGDTSPRNISIVKIKKHVAWHILFGNMTPKEIASEINRYWLDPDWQIEATRVEAEEKPACNWPVSLDRAFQRV